MIYTLSFHDVSSDDVDAPELAARRREAVEQGCSAAGFVAYACWPHKDEARFHAVVEGDTEIERVQSEIVHRSAAHRSEVLLEHQLGDAVAALAGELRAQAIVEAVVTNPGRVCGNCSATILPHYSWCEYRIEGGTTVPDGTSTESAFGGSGSVGTPETASA